MAKAIAKCGIDCSTCPWGPYPRKGMTPEEFEQYRRDAKRILGYMPIRTACFTCQTPDAEIPRGAKLPSRKCLIRQCVDKTGVANCAYCSRFPCDTARATSGAWNREKIEKELGTHLSEEEYHTFVEPFEGLRRLEAVHTSLGPEQIVDPARGASVESKIVGFPEKLPYSKEEKTSLRAIHMLIGAIRRSSLDLTNADTFAQQHRLENLRTNVLRFLWILGCHGKFEKDLRLAVDARTFEANRGSEKRLVMWPFLRDTVFKGLSKFGVRCELVAMPGIKEEELTTGTGYLRSKGWNMKMRFDERTGGVAALKAFQTYAGRLCEKHGKKAFQRFSEADMQVLLED